MKIEKINASELYNEILKAESPDDAADVAKLLNSDGKLEIEICGTWVWVSGDTKPVKEGLKAAGFRWAPKKMKWYWKPAGQRSFGRGKWSMDEIREFHGSERV